MPWDERRGVQLRKKQYKHGSLVTLHSRLVPMGLNIYKATEHGVHMQHRVHLYRVLQEQMENVNVQKIIFIRGINQITFTRSFSSLLSIHQIMIRDIFTPS